MSIQTLFGLLDAPSATTAKHRTLGLHDAGVLVQLLAEPEPAPCPHCGKTVPPPKLKTRKRRLYDLATSAGAVLHTEIEP